MTLEQVKTKNKENKSKAGRAWTLVRLFLQKRCERNHMTPLHQQGGVDKLQTSSPALAHWHDKRMSLLLILYSGAFILPAAVTMHCTKMLRSKTSLIQSPLIRKILALPLILVGPYILFNGI